MTASGMIVDFTYGDANPAALQYLQRPASDLIGARLLHLFPKQATGGLFQRYVETVESGTPLILSAAPFDSEISAETRRFDFRGVVVNGGLSLTWRDVTSEYREPRGAARIRRALPPSRRKRRRRRPPC
ncbi:MAG: hypothetical protein V9E85_10515 [Candidatus Nanopelagicales bacterium]